MRDQSCLCDFENPEVEVDAATLDAVRWFLVAVGSLAVAGLLAVVLVVGRVPVIASTVIRDSEFARRSLIVHVNLAMGAWFFSCLAGLFCLMPGTRRTRSAPAAVSLAVLGMVAFTVPVFFKSATPVLSNYVAALDHKLFLAGLAIFAGGVLLNFADPRLIRTSRNLSDIPGDAQAGLRAAVLTFFAALLTFAGAAWTQSPHMDPLAYYERLFWGGGHVLQAANTLGMLASWLILLSTLTGCTTVRPRIASLLFAAILMPHLTGPWLTFGGHSSRWFTRMMEFGLFPVATVLLIYGAKVLWHHREALTAEMLESPAFVGLATSSTMTVVGFVLGAMITADTTLIPAHYHANIGAVSVAYMAVLLMLVPRLGGTVSWPRLAAWQPLLFGAGQMTFVLGLAVAGTLGQAARKTYGRDQHLTTSAEWIGLIIVGVGGIIAFTGGVLFVVIMMRAILSRYQRSNTCLSDTIRQESEFLYVAAEPRDRNDEHETPTPTANRLWNRPSR